MDRQFSNNPLFCDMRGPGRHGGGRGAGGERPRRGRLFDYGEFRLLVLALIAERPAHGYELIKTIEERFGGSYTPSPGVIYPTLAWLEDMGYTTVDPQGGRKSYAITAEGAAFLNANKALADALLNRASGENPGRPERQIQIMRAMQNLKTALRLQLGGAPDQAKSDAIAAAIDEAAKKVGGL